MSVLKEVWAASFQTHTRKTSHVYNLDKPCSKRDTTVLIKLPNSLLYSFIDNTNDNHYERLKANS